MKRWLSAVLACTGCWLGSAGRVHASDTDENRHLGVQVRALVGPALLYAFQDVGPGESGTTRGVGAAFEVALGTMVSENLALNMDLVLARSADAEHGVLTDTNFSAVHFGAGVTYWLMPANVYLAGSIGLARSSIEGSPVHLDIELPTNEQSKIGVGAHLAIGKQFWLSRRVGLGATLSLLSSAAANPAAGLDTSRYVVAAVAALCATLH
jgi:hypothetical protein